MGRKYILLKSGKIKWETTVEGTINGINVNKSGYVSVLTAGTSYKSVIITIDTSGKELFKTYLASTIAVAADVSVDNKYLAIAEVNTSGALIESSIKIIDIEKATQGDTTNSVIYKNTAETGKLITNIKYQEKGQLICLYDDSIHVINDGEDTELLTFDSNVEIVDINLKSYTMRTEEISTGLFTSRTDVILTNVTNEAESIYSIDSVVKEVICYNQIIAVNLGTEIHFINLNGWLEKKYTSTQEIKDIVIGTSVAGIVYRDRIKVLKF